MNCENRENQQNQKSYYKKIVFNRKGQIGIAVCVVLALVGIIVAVVYATSGPKHVSSDREKAVLSTIPSGDRQEVYAGIESFEITCQVSHYGENEKLQWMDAKNKSILESSENPKIYAGPGNDTLKLKFVKPTVNRSGEYTCSYSGIANQIKVTITFIDVSDKIPRFEQNYEKVKSIEGTPLLSVPCFARGSDLITYEWYDQAGYSIQTTSTEYEWPYISQSGSVLNIPKAEKRRSGLYSCTAKNKYGSDKKTFEILIFKDAAPHFTITSEYVDFHENNTLVLYCMAQGAGPLIFEFYNQQIETIVNDTSSGIYVIPAPGATLVTIESANITHEGEYRCVVSNDYGSTSKSLHVSLRKDGRPKFSPSSPSYPVFLNNTLHLTCDAEGAEPMTYDWYNQKNELITNELIANGSSLTIKSAKTTDEGLYTCSANNDYGTANKTFKVSIDRDGRPKFYTVKGNWTAYENAEYTQFCMPTGSEPMTFVWLNQKNQSLENSTSYSISTTSWSSSLIFKSMQTSDLGEYRCLAANSYGASTTQFYLSFSRTGLPKCTDASKKVNVEISAKFQLQCQASGEMPIIYTWYNQSDEITSSLISTKSYGSYLTVEHAQWNDSRIYTCVAKNAHGLDTMEFHVYVLPVLDKMPRFEHHYERVKSIEGYLLSVACSANGSEPITYEWYDQYGQRASSEYGLSYFWQTGSVLNVLKVIDESPSGLYSCKAKNEYGSDQKTFEILMFKDAEPHITSTSGNNIYFYENNTLVIFCAAQGAGPLIYEYYNQQNETITNDTSSGIYITSDGVVSFVIIESANIMHEGGYRCVIRNDYGSASKTLHVSLIKDGTPNFRSSSSNDVFYLTNSFSLLCDAEGAKPMTYDWYNPKNELITNELIANGSRLTIESGKTTDKGQYRCLAKKLLWGRQ